MSVTESFLSFKSNLELPDRAQAKAATAQQQLRELIQKHLAVTESFLTGSYPRFTKIFPLNDIDVFLVRNTAPTGLATDGRGVTPDAAISEVESAVRRALPGAQTKAQARSVNVAIPGLEFGFDLVPAWMRSPDGYWIPDRGLRTWLPTNPKQHAELLTTANKATGGYLKPVIKMIKHWSRNNTDALRSFHIELMLVRTFQGRPITTYQSGVAAALAGVSGLIGQEMVDPVYGLSRVDKALPVEELRTLKMLAAIDAQGAHRALELERVGRDAEAFREWSKIFVSGFPQ